MHAGFGIAFCTGTGAGFVKYDMGCYRSLTGSIMLSVRAIHILALASPVAMWAADAPTAPIRVRYFDFSLIILVLFVCARLLQAFLSPGRSRTLLAVSVAFTVVVVGAILTIVELTLDSKWLYLALGALWFIALIALFVLQYKARQRRDSIDLLVASGVLTGAVLLVVFLVQKIPSAWRIEFGWLTILLTALVLTVLLGLRGRSQSVDKARESQRTPHQPGR